MINVQTDPLDIQTLLKEAVLCHEAGDLEPAEDGYVKVLEMAPENTDALHNLGLIKQGTGDLQQASKLIDKAIQTAPHVPHYYVSLGNVYADQGMLKHAFRCYQQAIDRDPGLGKAYTNMGNVLFRMNLPEASISTYKKALAIDPDQPDALNNLGLVYHAQHHYDLAEACFRKLIQLDPLQPDAYNNLGNTLSRTGALNKAIVCYKKAVSLNPNHSDAHYNLGNLFHDLENFEKAASSYEKALELNPTNADVYVNLGKTRHKTGDLKEALELYEKAATLTIDMPELHFYMGNAFLDQLNPEKAIQCYEQMIKARPDHRDTLINMGIAFHNKDALEQARACFEKALKIDPNHARAFNNLGKVYRDQLNLGEALSSYNQAIRLNPQYAEAHSNRAFALLLSGRYKEGWQEYDWRIKGKHIFPENDTRPLWEGTSHEGKSVTVYAEQGIGDEIMFSSCLTDLANRVKTCFVECDSRLRPLFKRSFHAIRFFDRLQDKTQGPPESSAGGTKIALGSLPSHFRKKETDFPKTKGFLIPDPAAVNKWQKRYETLGRGLYAGISWRAGKQENTGRTRTIALEQWHDLLSISGVHFINLQYGHTDDERATLKNTFDIPIHHWNDSDPLKDMDDFAAQIAALNLVISVDNSTVHLAGALGVPVWTLLPFAPDWRWGLDRNHSTWYGSMRLFRQKRPGDWTSVLNIINAELNTLIDQPSTPPTASNDPNALNRRGVALLKQGLPGKAVDLFHSALEFNPQNAGIRMNLGIGLINLGLTEEAVKEYETVIQNHPEFADAWYNLANALKALGKTNDALMAYRRALEIKPDHVEALRQVGVVHLYTKDDPDFIRLTRMEAKTSVLDRESRISLHFALGKAYGDVQEYETAFSHYKAGATLKRQSLQYDFSGETALFQKIRDTYSKDCFNGLKHAGYTSEVPIFILGMPRSGTTLVEQILGSHPKVHAAGELDLLEKTAEKRIFFTETTRPTHEALKHAGQRYVEGLRKLAHTPGVSHITDKMPGNFLFLGYIHLVLPMARIIHCVRNPVDTCLSCFEKLFTQKQEWSYDLEELGRYYLQYQELMHHWKNTLPHRFLDVAYEDMIYNTEDQIRRLLNYCGLDWSKDCLSFNKTQRAVKTASDVQVRRPLYTSSLERWKRYKTQLEPLIRILKQGRWNHEIT